MDSTQTTNASTRMSWWLGRLIGPAGFLAAGLLLLFCIGIAQRLGWIATAEIQSKGGAREVTHTCPMHPQIWQPGPGRCPICGMPLEPATAAAQNLDPSLSIPMAHRRLSNIQTVAVKAEPLAATIETVGTIAIDESRMATIASYVDGRLERIFADYTGVNVAAKDHLAVVYSPELFAAQVEYLEARDSLAKSSPSTLPVVRQAQQKLLTNSRQKLTELGMQEAQIVELEKSGQARSRLTIYAPSGGTVIEKLAMEGKYIKAGDPIYRIADLSMVWLMLELYPEDAARIRFGQRVKAAMKSLPGRTFEGRVAFIDPTVDVRKRTVGVRVEFRNDKRELRPGDYANATIYLPIGQTGAVFDAELAGRWISPMHPQIIRAEPGECPICGMDLVPTSRYGYANKPVSQPASLYVPRSALLMAGKNSVVYVETEPGRFELRRVTLGPILPDKVVILSGLRSGEQVATAGNFLIDSQMQLAGKPSLIDPRRAAPRTSRQKTPLAIPHVHVEALEGDAGQQLEGMYAAYFRIQQALAADKTPQESDAAELHQLAGQLAKSQSAKAPLAAHFEQIAKHSENLHKLDIKAARLKCFRPISLAMVQLAASVRGAAAQRPLHHMFCPMVEGGEGDWLQVDAKLVNPYWGAKMLTCGTKAHSFPPRGHTKEQD